MRIGYMTTMAAAVALAFGFTATASAQSSDLKLPVTLSYSASTQKDTWNTVLIVSGVVLVVGLITDESALTLLGGAGVIVSLVQSNKFGYAPQYSPHGIDLIQKGPVSFGVNPFGQMGITQGFKDLRPSAYISANFRF